MDAAELAQERKAREERRTLVAECDRRVSALEREVLALLGDVDRSEQRGTAGRERGAFLERVKLLNEKGTVIILSVDRIQATSSGSKRERDAARAERKKLVSRIQACTTKCAAFS